MSFAGRLARGLAAGLGNYLVQEGLARLDDERRARILKDREQALADYAARRMLVDDTMPDLDTLEAAAADAISRGIPLGQVSARLRQLSERR